MKPRSSWSRPTPGGAACSRSQVPITGWPTGALEVTGEVRMKARSAVLALRSRSYPTRNPYRCPFGIGGQSSAQVAVRYVERLLDDPCGGITPPAAMILELVQGQGGVVPAPDADGWPSTAASAPAAPAVRRVPAPAAARTGRDPRRDHRGAADPRDGGCARRSRYRPRHRVADNVARVTSFLQACAKEPERRSPRRRPWPRSASRRRGTRSARRGRSRPRADPRARPSRQAATCSPSRTSRR